MGEGAYIAGLMGAMEAAKAGITIPSRDDAKVMRAREQYLSEKGIQI